MKNLYALLFSLLFATGLSAQLADGSKMPDITLTDINGNVHRLQDYLDAGKTIIIDIYATWCGPCWYLHENHALGNLHDQYGPEGTDEMVIFSIEGDATTSHADLLGTGTNTQGDWVTGVEYNIVEDNSVPGLFNLTYWPTIYIIRPSGSMLLANDYVFNNVFDPTFDYVYDAAFRGENDAAVSAVYTDRYFCGSQQQSSYLATVKNMGTDTLTYAFVELLVNGEVKRTKEWNGTLGEFKSVNVSLTGLNIEETSVLELRVSSPNHLEDSASVDNVHSWNVIEPSAHESARLTVTTDFWPEEVSWSVTDPDGNVVATSEDLGALSCNQTYVQEFPLTGEGCYEVAIVDGYGDGLLNGLINPGSHSCPGNQDSIAMGAVALEIDGEVIYSNISYGDGVDVPFNFSFASSVEDIDDIKGLNVYPNPVSDNLVVEFNATQSTEVSMSIIDMMGRVISNEGTKTFLAGQNTTNVNVANLVHGTYFLRLLQNNAVETIKFEKM